MRRRETEAHRLRVARTYGLAECFGALEGARAQIRVAGQVPKDSWQVPKDSGRGEEVLRLGYGESRNPNPNPNPNNPNTHGFRLIRTLN